MTRRGGHFTFKRETQIRVGTRRSSLFRREVQALHERGSYLHYDANDKFLFRRGVQLTWERGLRVHSHTRTSLGV